MPPERQVAEDRQTVWMMVRVLVMRFRDATRVPIPFVRLALFAQSRCRPGTSLFVQ
jgi:hypothetical protein